MEWIPLPSLAAEGFDTLGVNIKNFKKPLDQSISRVMVPSIKQNFASGGRPEWQPLTNTTQTLKALRGHGPGILKATKILSRRAGAVSLWDVNGASGVAAIRTLPAAIAHGIYHQTGWSPAKGPFASMLDVEARPWAVIQQEDANDIEEIFFEWIEERIRIDIATGTRSGF